MSLDNKTSARTLATTLLNSFLEIFDHPTDANQVTFNTSLKVMIEDSAFRADIEKLLVRSAFDMEKIIKITGQERILDIYICDAQDEYQDSSALDDLFILLLPKSTLLCRLINQAYDNHLDSQEA